jgi:c-di-GMP-binding flagellar brake protein YcgR
MVSWAERRRYNRLFIPLSVEYCIQSPETGEVQQGKGVLRDISLSGGFFHTDPSTSFKPGQIVSLTIAAPLPFLDYPDTSHLWAKGEVVRLEPPDPANPSCGVALQFLNGLSFASSPLSPLS